MRPDVNRYFMDMARLVASRSTCVRRSVGCVLVDTRKRVLATGYNGVAVGEPHCNEVKTPAYKDGKFVGTHMLFPNACPSARAKSGKNIDGCFAVHAEQNAILQCSDADKIHTAYVTAFPCPSCTKLLLNTGCEHIVFDEDYGDDAGYRLWVAAGGTAWKFEGEPPMIQRDLVRLFGEGDDLNPWRVVVACVCLNLASARVARGIVMRILERWPTPTDLAMAELFDLEAVVRPLGLHTRRAKSLIHLSQAWHIVPIEQLPGVGPYALESVRVFCHNELPDECADRKVSAWVEWKRNAEKL